jgi:hypothetical protein
MRFLLSKSKWIPAFFLASALLLCSSPLMAALRSRTQPRGKTQMIARLSHPARRSSHSHRASRSHHSARHSRHESRRTAHRGTHHSSHRSARSRGQQSIDSARTLEIQQALIRKHYLAPGQDTGKWDQATRDALTHLQGDNNWQTKIVPDSRALIKLGLGPSRKNLLNPQTAAIAMPGPTGRDTSNQPGVN